ncbi:MAG: ATP-binding cassette domain-containing protein [Myxococcota bacterium]
MTAPVVVAARGLQKSYGEVVAVRGIDFEIGAGEFFGFLGPNGAGKTTTMSMLQAVARRTGGQLEVLGLDPAVDGKRIRQRIGVCPQEDNLDPDLQVRDNLLVYARYFGVPRREARRRAQELLALMQLEHKADVAVSELSGGMKRRLTLARSLVNEPELVILDEPSTGLDPQARHLIWQKLRQLRERGCTLLLTTHYMDEAERLCDRLVVMDRGRILASGAPAALIEEHVGREVVELTLPFAGSSATPPEETSTGREAEDVALRLELTPVRSGDQWVFFFRDPADPRLDRLTQHARQRAWSCRVRRAGLEDVFLQLTGRELLD